MGIAEHRDDNRNTFSFSLTQQDNSSIQAVLERANELTKMIGECGAEYR